VISKSKVTLAPRLSGDAICNALPAPTQIAADDSAEETYDQRPPNSFLTRQFENCPDYCRTTNSCPALCAIIRATCNYFRDFFVKSLKFSLTRAEPGERQKLALA